MIKSQSGFITIFDVIRLILLVAFASGGLKVGLHMYGIIGAIVGCGLGAIIGVGAWYVVGILVAIILKLIFGGPFFTPKANENRSDMKIK